MKTSKFGLLDWKDLGKGVLVAVLAFLANWAQNTFIPSLNVSQEVKVMLITGIAYLIKNWLTPQSEVSNIQFLGGSNTPPKKDEK
jgi:hypothetical protein